MKQIVLLLLCSCSLNSCISTVKLFEKNGKLLGILPLEEGKVVYRDQVNTIELPKEEVFRRARRWWVMNYRSAKDVFQLVDKETGEIVGKGNSRLLVRYSKDVVPKLIRVNHVISLDVSEDDYVVRVTGLEIEPGTTGLAALSAIDIPVESYNIGNMKSVLATFQAIDDDTRKTLQSLQRYIKKPTS